MKIKTGRRTHSQRWLVALITSAVLGIALILITREFFIQNIISLSVNQQKYIYSAEAALLGVMLTEMLARTVSHNTHEHERQFFGPRFRIMVRIVGYLTAIVSVISILASNPTLGISAGAIAGIVIAFATQNLIGNMLAAVLIINTRMVQIGEEITVTGVKGKVADINLSHTIVHVEDDVVFIPNTVMVSNAVRRKKRKDVGVWSE
jgi:small-conductance mechanosensitive channel